MKTLKIRVEALILALCLLISGMPADVSASSEASVAVKSESNTIWLDPPSNIRWDGDLAKWDTPNEDVDCYTVTMYRVEGNEYIPVYKCKTPLKPCKLVNEMKCVQGPGKYVFDVEIDSFDGNYRSKPSVKSEIYELDAERIDTPTGVRWNGKVAEWEPVDKVDLYNVILYKNGEQISVYKVSSSETQRNLEENILILGAGEYTFEVSAAPKYDDEKYCVSNRSERSGALISTEELCQVQVGDVKVTTKNCNDVLGDRKIKYEPATQTLTLKGINITDDNSKNDWEHKVIQSYHGIKIVLEGENFITTKAGVDRSDAIYCAGNLEIAGTGSLNVRVTGESAHYNYAISCTGNMYIGENAKVTAVSGDSSYSGQASWQWTCGIDSGKDIIIGGAAVVKAISGNMENGKTACGMAAENAYLGHIIIKDDADVTVIGQHRAFLYNTVNPGSLPVKVNTEAKEEGAVDWNKEDDLGGRDSTFKYVRIGSGEKHIHKNGSFIKGTPATLTENGIRAYYKCVCGRLFEDSGCKKEINTDIDKWKVISYPKNISLEKQTYKYSGKTVTPKVKVTDSLGKVIDKSAYTVSYQKGRKNVGTYKVTVKFNGNYSGVKTLSFKINPKGTKIKSVKALKKGFTLKWKKISLKMTKKRISGYQIQYAASAKYKGAKKKNVKGFKKTGITVKKLKAKKGYYVRMRTYIKVSGKTYYSAWSKTKKVKTKK